MFLCFTTTLDIPHMHRSLCEFSHNGISSSRRISPCLRPFGCCGGRRVLGPFHRGIFITFMVYRFQSLDASKRTHTHTIDKMQVQNATHAMSLDFALTKKTAQFTDVFLAGWIYPHLFRTLPAWISCCQPTVFLHQVWSQVLPNMPHGLQSTATSRSCFPGF